MSEGDVTAGHPGARTDAEYIRDLERAGTLRDAQYDKLAQAVNRANAWFRSLGYSVELIDPDGTATDECQQILVESGYHAADSITCNQRVALAVRAELERNIRAVCNACRDGREALLLDAYGVRAAISGKPGTWAHAVDEHFWSCAAAALHSLAADGRTATALALDLLRDRVAEAWPFAESHYPALEGFAAAVRHVVLHFAKDTGRLAAAIEREDHGEAFDRALMRRPARNALVNALRLCSLLGLHPAELLEDYHREISMQDPVPAKE
jgi:hypothetical protein